MYYTIEDGEIIFEGEPVDIMALFGLLMFHDYECDFERDDNMIFLVPDASASATLNFLEDELSPLGLDLEEDTWTGVMAEEYVLRYSPVYDAAPETFYPIEYDGGRDAYHIPFFGPIQLELEL